MKKRKVGNKMTLSKETVRTLTQEDYREANVAGGGPTNTCSITMCYATDGCCQWT